MSGRPLRWVVLGTVVALTCALSCTGSYLFDERRESQLPKDRSFALEGRFCTVGTNEVNRPIKILIAMDASQSMKVTDPDGTRAKATVDLINALPQDPEVYVAVMLFAGSTTAFLTGPAAPTGGIAEGFVQITSLSDADKTRLNSQILTFTAPQTNRDSTDFVKALAEIYAEVNADISLASRNLVGQDASARGRYSIIFLSDGHPTSNQDDELLRGDAVTRIRQLKDLADDVVFNTVHVFNPVQPVSSVCDLSGDAGTGCPLLLINQDSDRLEKMAELGGGNFRDFRNNEPINFLDFSFGQVRRAFLVKDVVATNFSAPKGSPLLQADTDGDGLTDEEELLTYGTDPNKRDTDGDGFSDGVEVHFAALGAPFDPTQIALPDGGGLDPGCPPALRGKDNDCDGLLDCDEQLIGTNATSSDSDRDGIPDAVEWQMGTEGSSQDLQQDPDLDGLINRDEDRRHMDPRLLDTNNLSVSGYRYTVDADGPVDASGRQCYRFKVENISLAETLPLYFDGGVDAGFDPGPDAGWDGGLYLLRGPGYNDVMLSVSMVPADDPTARTIVRSFRTRVPRYPVGGIKSPVDGVLQVVPEDFIDQCGPVAADAGTP